MKNYTITVNGNVYDVTVEENGGNHNGRNKHNRNRNQQG